MYYIMKYEVQQCYGGSEEGGWWYDSGVPQWKFAIPIPKLFGLTVELSYKICRYLNEKEHQRRERENTREYTSVLSYEDVFYSYGHSDTFRGQAYPAMRPYYE